jgi:hypothetical protein
MLEAIGGQWFVVLHYIYTPFHTVTHTRAREAPAHGAITRSDIQT